MNLIKSKQRVADHGEVFTPEWLVDSMLDLVKDETERLDSRFLEPACGSGNFLTKILKRKLLTVEVKYAKSGFDRNHYALLSLMCIYGIELLEDNIVECKGILLEILSQYLNIDKGSPLYGCADYVLNQNIVHGDALTMKDIDGKPIAFAEWGYLGKGKFQRRDFRFDVLTGSSAFSADGSLFADLGKHEIFQPIKTYEPMTIVEIAEQIRKKIKEEMMTEQASFTLRNRNPDVLTCIANLSNDEVFTPPEFANQMLDMLTESWAKDHKGENIWENKDVKFLDPCTKSGVFLREITARLTQGLEKKIPNLENRVDHILSKQVYGIGITKLTSLLARRSVYCSKSADGEHSIAKSLNSKEGNIWYENLSHTWSGEKCQYCGAAKSVFGREKGLESHAYALIHSDSPKETLLKIFGEKMQFDVIIGNPPYQLNTEGHGTQARPIYHKFIEQAKALEPRYLSMVIPARWFSGGMGLDEFRASMLSDSRLRVIEDFPDSNDVFPGTQIKGGVCYFLWNRENSGKVKVTTHDKGSVGKSVERPLLEHGADVFIRYNEAIPILKKVIAKETNQSSLSESISIDLPENKKFMRFVSSIGAFGLESTFRGKPTQSANDIKVYRNGGVGYLSKSELTKEKHMVDKWKVFIPRAGSGSDSFPHSILGKPFVGEPGSISSWTYMYIGPFSSKKETENVISYISSRLFRFLVLLHKPSQDATKSVYTFVPTQDFSENWTDEKLYKKYGITQSEIEFINNMIRPMGESDE